MTQPEIFVYLLFGIILLSIVLLSIVFDIVIPTIKQIFMDALRVMLYGNDVGGNGAGYRNYSNPDYVSYGNSYVKYTDISRNRKPQPQRYNYITRYYSSRNRKPEPQRYNYISRYYSSRNER